MSAQTAAPRSAQVTALALLALIASAVTVGFLTLPWQAMIILSTASLAAYIAWLKTGYYYPVRSRRVIAAYLAAVGFQFIHMAEEYNGHFPHEFVTLFHTNHGWTEKSFLLTFVFGFGAIWLFAGAAALYQLRIANYFLWFYALGAGAINGVSHFAFAIIRGGYFPGLYTAAGHLLFSGLVLRFLLTDAHAQRRGRSIEESDALRKITA